MPFIPAPDGTYRCAINYTLAGQECLNVIHVVDGGDGHTPQTVADAVFDEWTTATGGSAPLGGPLQNLAGDLTCNWVDAVYVGTSNGGMARSSAAPEAGGSGVDALANELTLVMTLRTGFSGRSFRGRVYLPGIPDSILLDSNHVTAAYAGDVQQRAENFLNGLDGLADPLTWVVTSYFSEGEERLVAVNTPITTIAVNTRLDSQRRRMPAS